MALIKKPVTGMKDILPAEMELRNYCIGLIQETYGAFGFTSIETPVVEHIENLCSKQGGDNEKLIFKILKRGEKLRLDTAQCEADLVDGGLRYDLTVPLARYYSNHANELPSPFKSLQMGNVWRADRPQRGRYRQFMQCDIDILGDGSNLAEIELILATSTLLGKLDFKNFTIKINDRRILKAMAAYCGFPESEYDSIFITLDKMDKIGEEGVAAELIEAGYTEEQVRKYLELFAKATEDADGVAALRDILGDCLEAGAADGLIEIMQTVDEAKTAQFNLKFDPTLVRGMSYYTGTIFEISMDELGASVGGGGRYDKMIGKFTGQETPAVGFSVGFERIILILMESGYQIPTRREKVAYMMEKSMTTEEKLAVLKEAARIREEGLQVLTVVAKKNKKHQKELLEAEGYTTICEFYHEA